MDTPTQGLTWVADFEFSANPGHRPSPWCGVFFCVETGETRRLTFDKPGIPCPLGPDDTLVAFYASAELTCFLVLGWDLPAKVIDLYPEVKVLCGAEQSPGLQGWGLLDVCRYFGVQVMEAEEKQFFREVAIRGPKDAEEMAGLVRYCEADVTATASLFRILSPNIHLGQALLRGAFVAAIASMEHNGVPIDRAIWARLHRHWEKLLDRQTERVNREWPVYRQDKKGRWSRSLAQLVEVMTSRGIPWPTTVCGRPSTSEDTFKEMANRFPELRPLRELESSRSQFRLGLELAVGPDGRNRCLLSPFRAVSGRGQPSNARFVFGPSTWLRSLIVAPRGRCLIYSDLSSAEIGIAGALSGDGTMCADYSGDPYLAFARAAGLLPTWATKQTHGPERDLAKRLLLGVNYGMGLRGLSRALGIDETKAGHLLTIHKTRYHEYWAWVADVQVAVSAGQELVTRFGWKWRPPRDGNGRLEFNPRRAQNWFPQSTCGEILRLASIRLHLDGVALCCPVHDALLVEGPAEESQDLAERVKSAWVEAAVDVIGMPLKSDATVLMPGDRYTDPRGADTWASVMELLDQLDREELEAAQEAALNECG